MSLDYRQKSSRCFETASPGTYFVERPRLDAFLRQAGVQVVAQRARDLAPADNGWRVATASGIWQEAWLLGADDAPGGYA